MHELPQGQPFLQYLQQGFERVDVFDALVGVCSRCATAIVPTSSTAILDTPTTYLSMTPLCRLPHRKFVPAAHEPGTSSFVVARAPYQRLLADQLSAT